jgi:hypothetical protein
MVDWDVIATKMKERTLTLTEQAKIVKELRQEEAAVKEATREQGFLREAGKAEAAGNLSEAEEALRQAEGFALQETNLTTEQLNELKELSQEEFLEVEHETEYGEFKEKELSRLAEQISRELDEFLLRINQLQKLKLYYEQYALGLNKQITANPALKQQMAAEVGKYIMLAEETNDKIVDSDKRCRYLEAQLRNLEKRKKQLETETLKLEEELAMRAEAAQKGMKFVEEELRKRPGLLDKKTESEIIAGEEDLNMAIKEAQKNPAQAEKTVEVVIKKLGIVAEENKGTPVAKAAKRAIIDDEYLVELLADIRKKS